MGRRPHPDVHYAKMQRLIRRLARTPVDPARLAEIEENAVDCSRKSRYFGKKRYRRLKWSPRASALPRERIMSRVPCMDDVSDY